MAPNGNGLLPFVLGTRRRRQKVAVAPVTAGQSITPVILPKVGYLSSIFLAFEGSVTLSGPGALADLGPWALLNRITVDANMASASLWNTSGYGAFVMQQTERANFRPNLGGVGVSAPSSTIYSAPVASGANTVRFGLRIPIAFNAGAQAPLGLVNLQAPEVQVTLNISMAAATAYAALATAYSGNIHVYYEYFDVPDPRQFTQPPLMLVRVQEDMQPIAAVGDNTYTVPRQGVLFNLAHVVRLNGARSDDVDSTRIVFNKTDVPLDTDFRWQRFDERYVFGVDPITGVFQYNWADSEAMVNGGPGMTPARDAIDSEELTTLESIVRVASGAMLGVGNNTLSSIRRFSQTLAASA